MTTTAKTTKADEKAEDGTEPGLDASKAQTFAEAADNVRETSGEAYEKGYFGYVPSNDPDSGVYEDLTLQGVLKREKADKAAAAKAAKSDKDS